MDNEKGREASDSLQAIVPDGVRVTLYDQGYSSAAQPLQAIESTAMAVTAASACGTLVVLILFAFLFVGRERETVSILISLGTPAGKIRMWLLSGAFVISGTAALVGALTGGLLLDTILRAALTSAQGLYAVDQRYSEAVIGTEIETWTTEQIPGWPAAAAGLSVSILALVLCLLFLSQARRQSTPKQGRLSVRVPRSGTSTAGSGSLRFALISARRGGWRSLVIPAASLVLASLLGLLAVSTQNSRGQIDRLYDTAQITGQVTSNNGRQATNLAVSSQNVRLLWDSGLLQDIYVSLGWNYWLEDEIPYSGGSSAENRRDAWIGRQPELIALNDLSAASDFYYGNLPEIEWLPDWDESFLSRSDCYSIIDSIAFTGNGPGIVIGGKEKLTYPCLVSQRFLTERDMALRDTFSVTVRLNDIQTADYDETVTLQAVGAYSGSEDQEEIYVPLSFWCDPAWFTGEKPPLSDGERPVYDFNSEEERNGYIYSITSFSTCKFILDSAYELNRFRDYLTDQNISQVGTLNQNRITVVLQDQAFTETAGGLERYVAFSRILLPALCAVVILLGFVISWLMINGRRMEFAIMRGLGASRSRVFSSFFLEQAALAFIGSILAGLLLMISSAGLTGWLAAGIFWASYLAGCALAVLHVGKVNLMNLLAERE